MHAYKSLWLMHNIGKIAEPEQYATFDSIAAPRANVVAWIEIGINFQLGSTFRSKTLINEANYGLCASVGVSIIDGTTAEVIQVLFKAG